MLQWLEDDLGEDVNNDANIELPHEIARLLNLEVGDFLLATGTLLPSRSLLVFELMASSVFCCCRIGSSPGHEHSKCSVLDDS